MCDTIIFNWMRFLTKRIEAAGFRVCRFSFCTNYGIIFTDNSPNELLVWSGLKISVSTSAQLTKFSLPPAYSQCVPCGRRRKPPVFRLEHRGYCVYIQFSSAHADFSVWVLFFFVLRCTFVVFRFLPIQYTGCTRRDVL